VNAQRFFEKKKAETNAVVATKALAHKLARASYHIFKENSLLMPNAVSPEGRVR